MGSEMCIRDRDEEEAGQDPRERRALDEEEAGQDPRERRALDEEEAGQDPRERRALDEEEAGQDLSHRYYWTCFELLDSNQQQAIDVTSSPLLLHPKAKTTSQEEQIFYTDNAKITFTQLEMRPVSMGQVLSCLFFIRSTSFSELVIYVGNWNYTPLYSLKNSEF